MKLSDLENLTLGMIRSRRGGTTSTLLEILHEKDDAVLVVPSYDVRRSVVRGLEKSVADRVVTVKGFLAYSCAKSLGPILIDNSVMQFIDYSDGKDLIKARRTIDEIKKIIERYEEH